VCVFVCVFVFVCIRASVRFAPGLYEVDRVEDDKDRDVGRIAIKYVPRTNSGDLDFTETALRPGLYEFRWYLSGTCLAAVSRTFRAVLPDISLTAPRWHQCGTHLDIAYEVSNSI
jgi:hypothetical protein